MKVSLEERSLLFPLRKSSLLGCTTTIGRLYRTILSSFVILRRKAEVADLIGKEVDVPGPVFHDHTPGAFFRCVRPTWEHCFNPLLCSVWATDKDIHGQDEKLAEVMLRIFIRQSFIPDYSCCHRQAWINRPKTSSFKSYFKRAMSICRAYIMGPDSAHASAVVIRMLDNPRSRCDWRWFESYCILESNKKCLFTYENKQKAVNLFY